MRYFEELLIKQGVINDFVFEDLSLELLLVVSFILYLGHLDFLRSLFLSLQDCKTISHHGKFVVELLLRPYRDRVTLLHLDLGLPLQLRLSRVEARDRVKLGHEDLRERNVKAEHLADLVGLLDLVSQLSELNVELGLG